MYSDPAYGFEIWDSMLRGGPFNALVQPDFGDLARNQAPFMSVWSPGQYLFAGALEQAGLGLGAAMNVVTTVCTVLGLVGWYRLYRRWDFPAASAAIAVAITAGSRHLALPFGIYTGGEVLLFGGMPWFLLLLGRWSALRPVEAVGLTVAVAGIAFLKLSGILFAFAALAGVVVWDVWPLDRLAWRRPLTALVMAIGFAAAFYFLWASKGWTALDGKDGSAAWFLLVPRFFEGWGASVMSIFSLGDLAARVLLRPGRHLLPNLDLVYLIAAVPALLVLAWSGWRLRRSHPAYLRFAGATALFYVTGLALIYGLGSEISMEDRFYRPLGLVFLVGVVQAVSTARGAIRWPLGAFAGATMLYGVSSYVVRLQHNIEMPLGDRGFHHGTLTHDGLALLRRELRAADGDTIAWVMMPEIALEVRRARVLVSAEAERLLGVRSYHGHAGRLMVFLDETTIRDGKAEIVLKSFTDYDRAKWVATRLGDTTMFEQ
jgi:hypothetical protein